MQETPEDISNAARGHKANLSNPNTSDESKAHSKKVMESLGGEDAYYGKQEQDDGKDPMRVASGLKATINNPNIAQDTKDKAQEKLDNM